MVYKRFKINVWSRILLLILSFLVLAWLWLESPYFFTPLAFTAILILQTAELISYVEKTNRRLATFFEAFRYGDFTQSFAAPHQGASFEQLETAMREVMSSFQHIREEQEATLQYLESIVQHLAHGLLVFDQGGKIITINEGARQLLGSGLLQNIKEIKISNPKLYKALRQTPNRETTLLHISDEIRLSITVSEFKKRDILYRIVSIKNIQNELQINELEAWQNLTRVLTHEIVNSMTPISSTVSTVIPLLESEKNLSLESRNDLSDAMHIIRRRSDALLRLVQAYRTFTRIPEAHFTTIPVNQAFQHISTLYQSELAEKQIALEIRINPSDLQLHADRELLETVLINLMKNAIEALQNIANPRIIFSASLDERQRPIIRVEDNGVGIIPEAISKIFIPFYSTKPTGSGIGLSLCRKVMSMHQGFIHAESAPTQKTVFTLTFPKSGE